MSLALGAAMGFPLAMIIGIVLGLAGLSTALLCLLAISDGAVRRGLVGFASGVVLFTGGLWLVGFLG